MFLPCRLHEQRLRKFNSKDFMSDERKIESEVINHSVYQGEKTYANEVEGNGANRELRHV